MTQTDPFRYMWDWHRHFMRLFDMPFFPWEAEYEESGNLLPVSRSLSTASGYREAVSDLIETEKDYRVVVELPGISKENIELNLQDDYLEIKAEQKYEERKGGDGNLLVKRRFASKFYKKISLPSTVDTENIKATYKNGVLEIVIPKTHVKSGKKIKIF